MKFEKEDYVNFDPFWSDESERTCVTVKIVKCRKEHTCAGIYTDHKILPGEYARYEKALVDGDFWGRYYICIPCLEKEMTLDFDDE